LNLEGRLQQAIASQTAPADVRTNEAVLDTLAECLGVALEQDWKEKLSQRAAAIAITE
jgi:hypothetical protein